MPLIDHLHLVEEYKQFVFSKMRLYGRNQIVYIVNP